MDAQMRSSGTRRRSKRRRRLDSRGCRMNGEMVRPSCVASGGGFRSQRRATMALMDAVAREVDRLSLLRSPHPLREDFAAFKDDALVAMISVAFPAEMSNWAIEIVTVNGSHVDDANQRGPHPRPNRGLAEARNEMFPVS
jgi:hypothetical protein